MSTLSGKKYSRWNGTSWDDITFLPETHIHDDRYFTETESNNLFIPRRSGIYQSATGTPDSYAFLANVFPSASTGVGFEYDILLNAALKGYTITESGSALSGNPAAFFDGKLAPQYSSSSIGLNPADPYVLLIEGLPGTHSQTGGYFGWTCRYWWPDKFKIEGYEDYSHHDWITLLDQSVTAVGTKDLIIPLYPNGLAGAYTKFRITIYHSVGSAATDGNPRWGISEIFFIQPEAQGVHEYANVKFLNGFKDTAFLKLASGGIIAADVIFNDGSSTSPELKFQNTTFAAGIDLFNNSKVLRFIDRTASASRIEFDLTTGSISTGGNINEAGQRVYSPNNKPSLSALGSIHDLSGLTTTEINTAITNAMNALIASAPGALDTLNELAAALGDDPNFASTIATALAAKMPIAGGVFSGLVTHNGQIILNNDIFINGQIESDNENITFGTLDYINVGGAVLKNLSAPYVDTDASTKKYVDDKFKQTVVEFLYGILVNNDIDVYGDITMEGGYITGLITPTSSDHAVNKAYVDSGFTPKFAGVSTSTSRTLTVNDVNNIIFVSGAYTLTMPPNTFSPGSQITIMRTGASTVTIACSGVTINGSSASKTITTQYKAVTLICYSANVWYEVGI